MAFPVKTKPLTLLDIHSKILKFVKVKDNTESHSDLEVEGEGLDDQDLLETEYDSFLPASSSRWQYTHITVRYQSASTTIIV